MDDILDQMMSLSTMGISQSLLQTLPGHLDIRSEVGNHGNAFHAELGQLPFVLHVDELPIPQDLSLHHQGGIVQKQQVYISLQCPAERRKQPVQQGFAVTTSPLRRQQNSDVDIAPRMLPACGCRAEKICRDNVTQSVENRLERRDVRHGVHLEFDLMGALVKGRASSR